MVVVAPVNMKYQQYGFCASRSAVWGVSGKGIAVGSCFSSAYWAHQWNRLARHFWLLIKERVQGVFTPTDLSIAEWWGHYCPSSS